MAVLSERKSGRGGWVEGAMDVDEDGSKDVSEEREDDTRH